MIRARFTKLKTDMAEMTFPEKVDHIWTYYKELIFTFGILLFLVVALLSSVIHNLTTTTAFHGVLMNQRAEPFASCGGGVGHHIEPTQQGQQNTGHQTKGHIGVHGTLQRIVILGTIAFGDEHAGTHGDALKEAYHHVDEAGGRTDRSQSSIAQVFAHDPGVEGVIKLLEQITQENGEGEKQNFLPDGTCSQILGSGMGLVLMVMKPVAVKRHVRHVLKITLDSVIPRALSKVNMVGN